MNKKPKYRAAILLSAFGNSPYMSAQVESIVQQMQEHDVLVMVDDGSNEVPWSQVKRWPANFLVWSRLCQLGASHSFVDLVLHSPVTAEHYLLADQDDVWLNGKMYCQVSAQQQAGGGQHATTHLWCSGHPASGGHTSSARRQQFRPLPRLSPAHYCFETPAPGMTLGFNTACRDMIQSNEQTVLAMVEGLPHDRILFAILAFHAQIHVLAKPLVHYRQHDGNLVGAPSRNALQFWWRRLLSPIRAWRTATWGEQLYTQLVSNAHGKNFKSLSDQRLRTKRFDDLCVHFLLWCRKKLKRLAGKNGA